MNSEPTSSQFYAAICKRSVPPYEMYYSYFGKDPRTPAAYGASPDQIVQVTVRPVKKGEKSQYWGWWQYQDNDYRYIYPSKVLLDMVFPYGIEVAIAEGYGIPVNIIVKEIARNMKFQSNSVGSWRWTKLYFSPEKNITIIARIYLIEATPAYMIYELRFLPENEAIEYSIKQMKITGGESSLFETARQLINKNKLITFLNEEGKKSKWKQETYDTATLPEPISIKEQRVWGEPIDLTTKGLWRLSQQDIIKRIERRAKTYIRLHRLSKKEAEEIVKYAKTLERDKLLEFWELFWSKETFEE